LINLRGAGVPHSATHFAEPVSTVPVSGRGSGNSATISMSAIFFDTVSARDLFKKPDLHLSANIAAAEEEAQNAVESGEPIREIHSHGNLNTSLESTYEGTQSVADDLAERVTLGERKERLFGENIREAIAAFRPLWRKK
jgi:hypothetical protein